MQMDMQNITVKNTGNCRFIEVDAMLTKTRQRPHTVPDKDLVFI
jgi:hypothetical protein